MNRRDAVHIIRRPACAPIAGPESFRARGPELRAGLECMFAFGPTDRVGIARARALITLHNAWCKRPACDEL